MNYHRWSALFRAYDLKLRHNRVILGLCFAGAASGFFLSDGATWTRIYQAFVSGAAVFAAGALAKELDPDRPRSSLFAATLALAVAWAAPPLSPIALFWLIGCARFINRATGLRPLLTDTLMLLAVTTFLSWREVPLFGVVFGVLLILDALLPDGRRTHLFLGAAVLLASGAWLFWSDWASTVPPPWLVITLLTITIAFIPVILNSYHIAAAGDATGQPLISSRTQAGQAIALSAGLFLASWRGINGVALVIGLWAALVGVLSHYLLFARARSSAVSL